MGECKLALLLCITCFTAALTESRPISTGIPQPTDHFLNTRHETVNKACQGPLGCGNMTTQYKNTYVPDRFVYGYELHGNSEEMQAPTVNENHTIPDTIVDVQEEETDELSEELIYPTKEQDYISFKSNYSLEGLDAAVNILCRNEKNCSGTLSATPNPGPDERYYTTEIILCSVGLVAASSSLFFCLVYYFINKKARDEDPNITNDQNENISDDFHSIHLSSIAEEDEDELEGLEFGPIGESAEEFRVSSEKGSERYRNDYEGHIQVTEL